MQDLGAMVQEPSIVGNSLTPSCICFDIRVIRALRHLHVQRFYALLEIRSLIFCFREAKHIHGKSTKI